MEPMMVLVAGPQSVLCSFCQLIFFQLVNGLQHLDPNSKLPKQGRRLSEDPSIPDMAVIGSSAMAGCRFCRLALLACQALVRNIKLPRCEADPDNSSEGMITATINYPCLEVALNNIYGEWWVDYRLLRMEDAEVVESLKGIYISIEPLERLHKNPFPDKSTCHPATSTESLETWDQCRTWIRQCITSHTTCNSPLIDPALPSRLIDVSSDPPTLCLSSELPARTQYITLSHCWGSANVVTLIKSNLSAFQQGLPLDLPKTFQDAFTIARRFVADFNVRYIWIDSLCIVQDSLEDWLFESPRMADIYGNAFCNLAATSAPDGKTGLFFERDLNHLEQLWVRIKADSSRYLRDIDAICTNAHRWRDAIEEAPLNRRAWVYQEQTLSPRIFHFTKNEIFWQCQHARASETFPQGEPATVAEEGQYGEQVFPNFARMQTTKVEELNARYPWTCQVKEYCRRQLSHPGDKLPALSGIAQRFQQCFNGSQYLAGMWRLELERQLLWTTNPWRRETEQVPPESRAHRTPVYRAPSWSWASLDGLIEPQWPLEREDFIVQVVDARTTVVGPSSFGQVTHGSIRLRGKLFKARITKSTEIPRTEDWLQIFSCPSLASEHIVYSPDIAGNLTVCESEPLVYCMPVSFDVAESRTTESCYGLVLESTGASNGQFRRRGLFTHIYSKNTPQAAESIVHWRSAQAEAIEEFEESHATGEYTISII